MLLRNWLVSQAQQKMREAATQAAGEAMRGPAAPDSQQSPPQPPPEKKPEICHVGLVFALGMEAGGLIDRLSGVIRTEGAGFTAREGGLNGRRMVLIESGAGREKAARATEALIHGHKPAWILSAGFAGGLDARMKQGDMLMANSIIGLDGRELAIDFNLPADGAQPRLHVGRLLTVDRVIRDPAEKQALGQQFGALAVDMETIGVAEVCQAEKVRFLSVRVIIDTMDQVLPRDIDNLVKRETTAGRLGAAAGAIMKRPSSIKDMWQLKEDALVASERLAKFLVGVLEQLR